MRFGRLTHRSQTRPPQVLVKVLLINHRVMTTMLPPDHLVHMLFKAFLQHMAQCASMTEKKFHHVKYAAIATAAVVASRIAMLANSEMMNRRFSVG